MAFDVEAARRAEFPWTAGGGSIYLNSASTGPLPRRTLDAVHRGLDMRADPSRFPDALIFETFTRARELAAQLIGASPREIALSTNTSYGVNLAAFALPIGAGDVVLGPAGEFPANVYPWMAAAQRRGFEYRQVEPGAGGFVTDEMLVDAIHAYSPRVVALSWVGFSNGYRYDLAAVGRACRDRGAFFFVDAIQGLGALPLDVRECHVDVLACGAQKWLLSPWGTGFTYVRADLVGTLEPHVVGWTAQRNSDDFSRLLDYDPTWRDDARRFESLTLPTHDFMGFARSLELLLEIGPDEAAAHVQRLASLVVDWAVERRDGVLATPRDASRRAGIVSLRLSDFQAASRRLHDAGVAHSLREGCVRLSPHVCNTADEVARALSVLD